jgi:formylglycine-generating enzyme required for sulfatase activity
MVRAFVMDVDTLDPVVDYVEAVEEVVGACDVLIAVIGNRWLTSSDRRGKRRLNTPEDLVRLEIATALKRGIRVVPVLVEGATMPEAGELPDDLKALVRRNALEIGHVRFDADSGLLVNAVERALGKATEQRERKENERLSAKQQERLDREQREQEASAEIREQQEKEQSDARLREQERLNHESQPLSPVVPSTPPGKTEADETFAESPKLVYPVPPDAEKPPPSSPGGTGGKNPSKQVIAFLAIAAFLIVGGLIYLAIRPSQSPPLQPAQASASPRMIVIAPPAPVTTSLPVSRPSPLVSATPTKEELARIALDNATKDHPWVNSSEMKFVSVAGTQVLFSIWDTRLRDFETFVNETGYDATGDMYSIGKDGWKQRGATWKEPGFSQAPTHPVVRVSWNDAKVFCKWLTEREHSSGGLPPDREYRLPTDEEWSVAVGLKNESGSTPQEKDAKIKLYTWDIDKKTDKNWPPPPGAGNYAGTEAKKWWNWPPDQSIIEDFEDPFQQTAPVGSFGANTNGLYDMGGNVWQWCEDWYSAQAVYRVLRGASWVDDSWGSLLASSRYIIASDYRKANVGFRCIVAVRSQ